MYSTKSKHDALRPKPHVPLHIRKKIQALLLLKHRALGCLVQDIQDEYNTYYEEELCPQMFQFKCWLDMLHSMPGEVEIRNIQKLKVAFAHSLEQAVAIEYLRKMFSIKTQINAPAIQTNVSSIAGSSIFSWIENDNEADLINQLIEASEQPRSYEQGLAESTLRLHSSSFSQLNNQSSNSMTSTTSVPNGNESLINESNLASGLPSIAQLSPVCNTSEVLRSEGIRLNIVSAEGSTLASNEISELSENTGSRHINNQVLDVSQVNVNTAAADNAIEVPQHILHSNNETSLTPNDPSVEAVPNSNIPFNEVNTDYSTQSEKICKLAASLPKCSVKVVRLGDQEISNILKSSNRKRRRRSLIPSNKCKSTRAKNDQRNSQEEPAEKSIITSRNQKPSNKNSDWFVMEGDYSEPHGYENFMFYSDRIKLKTEEKLGCSGVNGTTNSFLDKYGSSHYFSDALKLGKAKLGQTRNSVEPEILRYYMFRDFLPQNKNPENLQISTSASEFVPVMSLEAIQIANIDADINLWKIVKTDGQLTFISSYGNFSEYFLWQYNVECKGFGLMPTDGQGLLAAIVATPLISYENFEMFTGNNDYIDVFDPAIKSMFQTHVLSQYPVGVDIFLASGVGYEGLKYRPQDLSLLQCILALETLREGGSFVLKLKDTYTDFGVGLIFYMTRCFQRIRMYKPESALPGERFLICLRKLPASQCERIQQFLIDCNEYSLNMPSFLLSSESDIKSVFGIGDETPSHSYLSCEDLDFVDYIQRQNQKIGEIEIKALSCLTELSHKASLPNQNVDEGIENEIICQRNQYLLSWKLHRVFVEAIQQEEDNPSSTNLDVDNLIMHPLPDPGAYSTQERNIANLPNYNDWIASLGNATIDEWSFVLSGSNIKRSIIQANALGGVLGFSNQSWETIEELVLPPNTRIYGEILPASKSRGPLLNIIDAETLEEQDISKGSYAQRLEDISKFIRDKVAPSNDYYSVTCTKTFPLDKLPNILQELGRNKFKFKIDYFKNDLTTPAMTKSGTAKDAILNVGVREIVMYQTKYSVPGTLARAGRICADFRYMVQNRVYWALNPGSNLMDVASKMEDKISTGRCVDLLKYLAESADILENNGN